MLSARRLYFTGSTDPIDEFAGVETRRWVILGVSHRSRQIESFDLRKKLSESRRATTLAFLRRVRLKMESRLGRLGGFRTFVRVGLGSLQK
jgi:hypothetical protein